MFVVVIYPEWISIERNNREYCRIPIQRELKTASAVRRAEARAVERAGYICERLNCDPSAVPGLVNEFRPEMYFTKEYIESEDTIHESSVKNS